MDIIRDTVLYRTGYRNMLTETLVITHQYIPNIPNITEWVQVKDNTITIQKGFGWDGDTGAFQLKSSVLASAVHDGLYHLLRRNPEGYMYREDADKVYKELCISAGMWRIHAQARYVVIRLLGGQWILPTSIRPILEAP